MAHRHARLTPLTRLDLVAEVTAGWSQAEVARRFHVSRSTVAKWVRRFREAGRAGLADRSSAPRANPRRTAPELERRICAVRRGAGIGPHRIAWALGLAPSTVSAVLWRCGLNRLDQLHRVSRRPVRYEHAAPGELLRIDVKRLGRIPAGGGHRVHGRSATTPRTHGFDELRRTRPYRPQTNGKAERFLQTLQQEWTYARPYRSNAERRRQLPRWLYRDNHRRPHGGIGGAVPASRL